MPHANHVSALSIELVFNFLNLVSKLISERAPGSKIMIVQFIKATTGKGTRVFILVIGAYPPFGAFHVYNSDQLDQ